MRLNLFKQHFEAARFVQYCIACEVKMKNLVNQYGNINLKDINELSNAVHIKEVDLIEKIKNDNIEHYAVVEGFNKKNGRFVPKINGIAISKVDYNKLLNLKETNNFSDYYIDCTGDACLCDEVLFVRAVFSGVYPNSKFSHNETVEAKIISESYGKEKQQHTFTLLLSDNSKLLIKGRNLYRNGLKRKKWNDESERENVLNEKHDRGSKARRVRAFNREAI